MKTPDHFTQLAAISRRLILGYHDDLMVHDRNAIAKHPECPFIHVTRDFGTYLIMLPAADTYPAAGTEVAYLFSTATREHLLREVAATLDFCIANHPDAIVHQWDGKFLECISYATALREVREYTSRIQDAWNAGQRAAA